MNPTYNSLSAALAIVITCSLQAPTIAAPVAEGSTQAGTALLTSDEQKKLQDFRKQIAALEVKPPESRDGLLAGLLNTAIPGTGTYYTWRDGGGVRGYLIWTALLDAAVMGYFLADHMGQKGTVNTFSASSQFTSGLIGVGTVHAVNGLFTWMATSGQNAEWQRTWDKSKAEAQNGILHLESVSKEREATITHYLSDARQSLNRGYPKSAVEMLERLRTPLSEDSRVLEMMQQAKDKVAQAEAEKNAQREQQVATALEEAQNLATQGKYGDAVKRIWYLPENNRPGEAMSALNTHREAALAKAEIFAKSNDHVKAVDLLSKIPSDIPDYNRVSAALSTYRDKARTQTAQKEYAKVKQIERDLYAMIHKGDGRGAALKLAEYNRAAQSGLVGGSNILLSDCISKLKKGTAKQGEALVLKARVETVHNGGFMVIPVDNLGGLFNMMAQHYGVPTQNQEFRVWVKSSRNLGLVDGDTVLLGVKASGTYTYNTVGGYSATVRAVEYKTRLDQ